MGDINIMGQFPSYVCHSVRLPFFFFNLLHYITRRTLILENQKKMLGLFYLWVVVCLYGAERGS